MGARIDDSDLLARLADHIVATKGSTLADALKALNVPHPSHRRIYTKWDRRGLGLVTEAAWRAKDSAAAARQATTDWTNIVAGTSSPLPAQMGNPFEANVCQGDSIPVSPPPRPSFLSRVKRFWE